MKNENATESNAITRTGRVAEIRTDMAVPTEALPEALGLGIEIKELLYNLHGFDITHSEVDEEGHQREVICASFIGYCLAREGIVEFSDGTWSRPTLIWNQVGIDSLRELLKITMTADTQKSVAAFVFNAVRDRQRMQRLGVPQLPADPVVFNKEAFQSQIKKTKKLV